MLSDDEDTFQGVADLAKTLPETAKMAKDAFTDKKHTVAEHLGPKYFHKQMVNLANIRQEIDELEPRVLDPILIKEALGPKLDKIQAVIEEMGMK